VSLRPIPLLAWLYDVRLTAQGIRFVMFGLLPLYLLRFENIESVEEIKHFSIGLLNSYNFTNRFFARRFLIQTMKRRFVTHRILVTPRDPERFWSVLQGKVQENRQSKVPGSR
jgi:hypothetical protein